MQITKEQLKQIIKEEFEAIIREDSSLKNSMTQVFRNPKNPDLAPIYDYIENLVMEVNRAPDLTSTQDQQGDDKLTWKPSTGGFKLTGWEHSNRLGIIFVRHQGRSTGYIVVELINAPAIYFYPYDKNKKELPKSRLELDDIKDVGILTDIKNKLRIINKEPRKKKWWNEE